MRTKTTLQAISCAALAGIGALAIGARPTLAVAPAGSPSAKATAAISQTQLLAATRTAGWSTILSNTIHTASQKDLFCDVSIETGLMTSTTSSSRGGKSDTSTSKAEVAVRCLVDGKVAYPGEIIFGSRTQELTATLEGIIGSCFRVDSNGNVILDENCVQPEEIKLVLSTMEANSFNFIYPNCTSGTHTLQVQAKINTDTTVQSGSASAFAFVGKGSATLEEVRMANNEVIELP